MLKWVVNARTIAELIWGHPANRGRRLRTLIRSAAWQARKRLGRGPIQARLHHDLKIRCYPDSGDASRVFYYNGMPDPQEMLFLKHYLRPGDNVIDAGANIGIYTLFLASIVGPDGHVLAFEPDSLCASRLRENVLLNRLSNVTVKQAAVADYAGSAEFSLGGDEAGTFADLRKTERTQTVEVVRLADEKLNFAAGKMDVEGAEPAALRGADLARQNPPVWLIELTRRTLSRSGTSLEYVVDLLRGHGYQLWAYDPDTRTLTEWRERPRKPGQVGDAIAIAQGHLDFVRQRLVDHRRVH